MQYIVDKLQSRKLGDSTAGKGKEKKNLLNTNFHVKEETVISFRPTVNICVHTYTCTCMRVCTRTHTYKHITSIGANLNE